MSNVSVVGGNSSTHRQLVIGDKTNVIAPINMSLVTSLPSIMPNSRISVSPIVPGTLRWKNKGDTTHSTTYFSSTSNSCGIVRLEKDVPHCQPLNTTGNSNKYKDNKEPTMEVKIDILGDGVLDGKKILTSFNNMKKSEASKQGIKLKRLEDLLKSPTESTSAQASNDEQDKPLNLTSNNKDTSDDIQESSEQIKTLTTKENLEQRSLFQTVSINNGISSQISSSLDTRKTTSLNHSSFSLVSLEKPSSSPSNAQIEIPMSQEMKIQTAGSPIPSLNIQIRSEELFQKKDVEAQNPSISKDSALSLHLNQSQKSLSSLVTNSSVPKFDLIHNGSYPKLNEDTSEESSTSQLSDSLGIPGIPTVVLDSFNKSSSNAGFLTRQSIRAKNSSKKRSSPISTITESSLPKPVGIKSPPTTNLIDVNKGTLTIKLESEDIIAAQPDTRNLEGDDKNALRDILANNAPNTAVLNGLTSSSDIVVPLNHNQNTSSLSFQDSRTPFSKRLEMLSKGISSKPSSIIPLACSEDTKFESPNLVKESNFGRGKKRKKQEIKANKNKPDDANQQKDLITDSVKSETKKVILDRNSESASDDDGGRLVIAEDNQSENESNSNKRKRSSSSEDVPAPYPAFMPIGPIPTILSQISEEEKPNIKSKSSNRPVRKTRVKRKNNT